MIDTGSGRHPLEVLAAEFVERYRRGEKPAVAEYTARHPELADQIRTLFPTALLMEDLKRGRLLGPDDAPDEAHLPERLGDCRVVREVGRGGMGVVYEAEQESLGRRVAVKVLTAQAVREPGRLRRFRREAMAMARLHHTNIVPVFEFGEHDGQPYYVMQFIDGHGLDRQPVPADPREVARLGLQAAEALAHAHAQGTLHRDVKPANLLMDGRGTVWVTDFGLAQLLGQDDGGEPGEVAGTLRYLAPERLRGQSDARADIYSLGLTLYELLAGRPAFDAGDRAELVRQVTAARPAPPRRYNPAVPVDLQAVVLRATAADPEARYPSAAELAADLRRFLDGKPVAARPVGPAERFDLWCRRNPAVAALTGLAAGLLLLVAVLASAGYAQTRAALHREEALRAVAEGQGRRAEANLELALGAFDDLFTRATRREPAPGADAGLADESELARPPVVSPEIAGLLQNLLKFYDQFGERNQSDARLRREIARAYRRVGDIQQRLGQFDRAETAYRRALSLYGRRGAGAAEDPDARREAAAVRNELGLALAATGRYAEAERAHRGALAALTGAAEPPGRYERARTHALLGNVLARAGRADEAETNCRRTLALLADALREDPPNPDYRLLQARAHRTLYFVLTHKGRHPEAAGARRQALALLKQLADDFPDVADYRYEWGEMLTWLPAGHWGPRHDRNAERQLRRAVDLAGELATASPAVPQYQALRAQAAQRLAACLQASGRAGEAEPFHREAVDLQRALANEFPSVPFYQLYHAEACRSLGAALLQRGEGREACALLEETIDAQQTFVKTAPRNPFGRMQLAHDYQALVEAQRRLAGQATAAKVPRPDGSAPEGRRRLAPGESSSPGTRE